MGEETYWVYVLELANGRKYVGHTNHLERRINEHREGKSPYTKKHKIKGLIYFEQCSTRSEAMKKEKFLKSGKGREWLKQKLAEQSASGGLAST